MPDQPTVQAVAVTDDALRVRVAPIASLKTAWKTTLLQVVSGVASIVLLVLSYLQTVNLATILSPRDALFWVVGLNILTLILRAMGTKPIVLDPPQAVTVKPDESV